MLTKIFRFAFLLCFALPAFAQQQNPQSISEGVVGVYYDANTGGTLVVCDFSNSYSYSTYLSYYGQCQINDANGNPVAFNSTNGDYVGWEWTPPDDAEYDIGAQWNVNVEMAIFYFSSAYFSDQWEETWQDYVEGNTGNNNPPWWVQSGAPGVVTQMILQSIIYAWTSPYGMRYAYTKEKTTDRIAGPPTVCVIQNYCPAGVTPICSAFALADKESPWPVQCDSYFNVHFIAIRTPQSYPFWQCSAPLNGLAIGGTEDSTPGPCTH